MNDVQRAQAALCEVRLERLAALRQRDEALYVAHSQGATVRQLAQVIGRSPAAVSKAIRHAAERRNRP